MFDGADFDGTTFTTIDVPGGRLIQASGINDGGQIVGRYDDPIGSNTGHGFLDSDGSFTPIDVPGARSTYATGINDGGQIVGRYDDTPPGSLPEPSSLLLLAVGVLGLAVWRWKQAA